MYNGMLEFLNIQEDHLKSEVISCSFTILVN